MRFARGLGLLLLFALVSLGRTAPSAAAAEEPATEVEAVAALLRADADGRPAAPSDEALARLRANPDLDPWVLVERLIGHGRQDVAKRLAQGIVERDVGPLLAYAEAPDSAPAARDRMREFDAAAALQASGDLATALRRFDVVRAAPGRTTVLGALASARRGDCLELEGRQVDGMEAWLAGGEAALRIGWWSAAGQFFWRVTEKAYLSRSLEALQRALEGIRATYEVRGDAPHLAAGEEDLGGVASLRGDLPAALRHYDEALGMYEALGQEDDIAGVRSKRSLALAGLGDFRAALDEQGTLAAYYKERPHGGSWAENQVILGLILVRLGDDPGASAAFARAIETFQASGDAMSEAGARGNLGVAHATAGRWSEAIAAYRAGLAYATTAAEPIGIATGKQNVADALLRGADAELAAIEAETDAAARAAGRARVEAARSDARVLLEEALLGAEGAGALGLACGVRATSADLLIAEGKLDEAIGALESVRDEAARLRIFTVEIDATATLARARWLAKDWPRALREARAAGDGLAGAFVGLAEDDLSRARALTPDVYDVGVSAAVHANRIDDLAYFLEAGRAAALLRGLGGRAAALRATVPEDILQRLADAGRAKVEAFTAWQKSRNGRLSVTKELWARYEALRQAEQKTLDDVTEAQRVAGGRLAPSRLVSISDLRARLRGTTRPGLRQVFAIFNFQGEEAFALLVEDAGARVVTYRREDLPALREAFATLAAARDGQLDAAALGVVKRLLVDPLKLPAGATRLFVCPDRDLAYLPLSAIVPDDWEVVWEPSATTYDLLAERRLRKGQAVLGLGDPDYHTTPNADILTTRGGPRLTPLPGTRVEVEAITGRADDRRLVGARATEHGLARELAAAGNDRSWKSVHLACHGLVDVELPALSCLAITPGDGEDGFLTSSEVLRLPLRTDLTVLSACQTGRGKFVRGEGVMSLTRAFMFAGAPRVVVSLWDVEDGATAFLMETFYREWNAGRGTAEALRLAQIAVRDREVEERVAEAGKPPETRKVRPWADPKYWAAWVLWGLPD